MLVEEDEGAATDAILGALRMQQAPWRVVALRLDETTMHVWWGSGKPLQTPRDLYDALRAKPGLRKDTQTPRRTTTAHGGR